MPQLLCIKQLRHVIVARTGIEHIHHFEIKNTK